MKKNIKLLVPFIIIAMAGLTYMACTGEEKTADQMQSQNYLQNTDMAYADDAKTEKVKAGERSGSVYFIKSVSKPETGKAADFTFDNGGKSSSFSELTKGKVVFLNFWGTWCPPCRREIPDIIQISKDLKAKDFIVIGIAMERDKENAHTKVAEYSEKNGIPYMNFVSTQAIEAAYGGIQAVPTTFIIDKDGKISEKLVGMRDRMAFMASINKVLK